MQLTRNWKLVLIRMHVCFLSLTDIITNGFKGCFIFHEEALACIWQSRFNGGFIFSTKICLEIYDTMFLAISYNLVQQNFQFFSFWILIIFLYTCIFIELFCSKRFIHLKNFHNHPVLSIPCERMLSFMMMARNNALRSAKVRKRRRYRKRHCLFDATDYRNCVIRNIFLMQQL